MQWKRQGQKRNPKQNLQRVTKKKNPKQWPVNFLRQIETFEWLHVCYGRRISRLYDSHPDDSWPDNSTISFYQHNVLRHSFMDKLKEERVSFCGDSFIPHVGEIGIVAMGCHPIELPPFRWRDSFRPVSQVYQDCHRGFYSAEWTRRP